MGNEVEFLLADKHKSFPQDGSIDLEVISQTGPKYQEQSVYNIFVICQGRHEKWSWFLPADKCWRFFQIDTIILGVCGQACPNYLKWQVCYFSTAC